METISKGNGFPGPGEAGSAGGLDVVLDVLLDVGREVACDLVQRARWRAMAKTATAPDTFRKKSKVVATTDLRDVPEGTAGTVIVVDGLTWIRYWVRFDNGISLGSIPRASLATPEDWKRYLAGDLVLGGPAAGATAAVADGDAGAADDGGGKTTPAGTLIPQKLLDRSAAARVRLAA